MRQTFVKWLVLCSLLLGLHARLFAQDPCAVNTMLHGDGKCHVEHRECPPGDPGHDGHCPAEHHHHQGICGHATPYAAGEAPAVRLGLPCSSSLWLRHEGDEVPEGPCLEVDVPPVI